MSAKQMKQKAPAEEQAHTNNDTPNNPTQSTNNKRVIMTVAFVVGVLLIIILGVGFYVYTKPMQGTSQGSDTSSSTQDGSSESSANLDDGAESSPSVSNSTVIPTPTSNDQQNQNSMDNQQNTSDLSEGQTNNNTSNDDSANPLNPSVSNNIQYVYVAESGDSLHVLVRKAMLNYLKKQNIQIDDEQKIFAETNIVQAIGPRYLMIGETVAISREVVAEWVAKSRDLTPAEKDAWWPYAQLVDYSLSM
jgi:cytoskeletal protein RodZ